MKIASEQKVPVTGFVPKEKEQMVRQSPHVILIHTNTREDRHFSMLSSIDRLYESSDWEFYMIQNPKKPASSIRLSRKRKKQMILICLGVCACLGVGLLSWGIYAGTRALLGLNSPAIPYALSEKERASIASIKKPAGISQETFDTLLKSAMADDGIVSDMDAWMLVHIDDYSQDILDFYLPDHDRFEFVQAWPDRDAYQEKVERLSESLDEVPALLQWDLRWGYQPYSDSLIYIAGCAPTCVSMIASYLHQDPSLTPRVMSDYAAEQGDFYSGMGTAATFFDHAAERFAMDVEQIETSEEAVTNALDEGKLLIFHMMPGTFTSVGHYIVGVSHDGPLMQIRDPNSVARTRMDWNIPDVLNECASVYAFSKIGELPASSSN